MLASLALPLALAATLPQVGPATTSGTLDWHELAVDPLQLALEHAPDDSSWRGALQALGMGAATVESAGIAGWSLVRLPQEAGLNSSQLARELSASGAGLFATPVRRAPDGSPAWATRDLMLRLDPALDAAARRAWLARWNLGSSLRADWGGVPGLHLVRTRARDGLEMEELLAALEGSPGLLLAELDAMLPGSSSHVPNDPGFVQCWGLNNTGQFGGTDDQDMDAVEAWDISQGDPSSIVVVIDTGVDQAHVDLNQIPGMDFTGQGSAGGPFNPCDSHGTAVAGCVSATIDNGIGTVGVAPLCVSASARCFISTSACNGSWNGQPSWTVDALFWAQSIGARVTNNSNYYFVASSIISTAYADTRAQGLVHFAAAGNFATSGPTYPASLPDVQAVAALDRDGDLAGFSNFGSGLALSAPGEAIYTTDRSGMDGYAFGDHVSVSGTSFASPYAAGVAALVLSEHPGLDAIELETLLAETAVDLGAPGFDATFGWGFVNAFDALVGLPQSYCTAKQNSQGCLPSIQADGLPSLSSAAPFLASAVDVLNGKNGILFYGYAEAAMPLQGGTMCVAAPVKRTGVQASGGNPPPDDCSGSYVFDFNLLIQSGSDPLLGAGTEVFAQYWMRDPADSFGSSLSDAVRFTIRP